MHTNTIAVTALIGIVGCGGTQSRPYAITADSTSNSNERALVVRMANKGEAFANPSTPPRSQPTGRRRIEMLPPMECEKKGRPMNAYYRPVIAFVRQQLLDRTGPGAVHESLVQADKEPKLGDGLNILVDPRGSSGELRIVQVGPPFYAPGTRWAEAGYCLHVVEQHGSTTIVVERAWSWIR